MIDKVELVAKAIYKARYTPGYWGGVTTEIRDIYLDMARAAIKAIEELENVRT